jgi:hypothetical protein
VRVSALEWTPDLRFCRAGRRGHGQLEIHLFLEGIHFSDLDFDAITQFEYPAGVSADEL